MTRISDSNYGELHIGVEDESDAVLESDGKAFRILVIGDFSGRAWRADAPAPSFKPVRIDRDNFEEVMAALPVTVDLGSQVLSFRELEDFHPDSLFQRAQIFSKVPAAEAPTPRAVPPLGGLLDEVLDAQAPKPARVEDANDLAAFIRRVSAGHTVKRPDAATEKRTADRHARSADLMRTILQHPSFKTLEAAWRGLFLLIRRLDTDGDLQLYLLDTSLPELVRNLPAVRENLKKVGRWGLLTGDFSFGQSETDAKVLTLLAGLAKSCKAPFLGEAKPPTGEPLPEAWKDLRKSAAAPWVGLLLPRFLLRLPYGRDTQPIESFPFEEMPEIEHGAYLWGNPVFAFAYLVGESFLKYGWDVGQRLERRIGGLPLHTYRTELETVAQPCAEVLMTEREAERILEQGFMPLASLKETDAALVVRFQSIAQPATLLAGLQKKTR